MPDEPPAALASYIGHLAFWRYADSFWHMPGMLKKRAKFVELAQDGARLARVRKVLLGMRLREDLPMATCLWFWSFVFLALQDEAAGAEVIDKILAEDVSVEDGELIRSCLLRYLAASERPGWRRVSRRVRDGRAAIRTAIYIVSAMFRSVCLRCKRPESHCLCASIPALAPRTRVVVLQHPSEARHPLNTARLAVLGLAGARLLVGSATRRRTGWRPATRRTCCFPVPGRGCWGRVWTAASRRGPSS